MTEVYQIKCKVTEVTRGQWGGLYSELSLPVCPLSSQVPAAPTPHGQDLPQRYDQSQGPMKQPHGQKAGTTTLLKTASSIKTKVWFKLPR